VDQLPAAKDGPRAARQTTRESGGVENASELSKRGDDRRREAAEEASRQPAVIVDDDTERVPVQV
jgi:hypothetical protein